MNAGDLSSNLKQPSRDERAVTGIAEAGKEWPRPLPVVLAPADDEALSSWVARHAAFYGLSCSAMRRYCVPDAVSLRALDRHLTPGQETRLAHLFRRDRSVLTRMTHAQLGPVLVGELVARDVDHRCEQCARSHVVEGHAGAIPRAWFYTWRITCARCGLPVVAASCTDGERADLFPHLWNAAVRGEQRLDAFLNRTSPGLQLLPTVLLRLLMISTASNPIPDHGGRTLDVIVPGFDAAVEQHGIAIPNTSLINVPLPARTALLAGLTFATEEFRAAAEAMCNVTSGMHRAHFGYVADRVYAHVNQVSELQHI